jgi:hypothetical protein
MDILESARSVGHSYNHANDMAKKVDEVFWQFWTAVLNDDHGVNDSAYKKLYELAQLINKQKTDDESVKVEATDGRFYLKG